MPSDVMTLKVYLKCEYEIWILESGAWFYREIEPGKDCVGKRHKLFLTWVLGHSNVLGNDVNDDLPMKGSEKSHLDLNQFFDYPQALYVKLLTIGIEIGLMNKVVQSDASNINNTQKKNQTFWKISTFRIFWITRI